ncbi:MAG: type II secretion system protein [Betaproteobacteria bacterium]
MMLAGLDSGIVCRRTRVRNGFTYVGVLILIALMGIALAGIGMVWSTQKKRENERELLFRGEQYRRAIGQYYERSPGAKQFPKSIDDLLLDPRYPSVRRYLRRPYADPMTGQAEWGLVTGPEGRVTGVFSMSKESPLKRSNFRSDYENFKSAERYSDWQFVYLPGAADTQTTGATKRVQ